MQKNIFFKVMYSVSARIFFLKRNIGKLFIESKIIKICVILSFAICLSQCAPSRLVKPLKYKEQVAGLTFGGPVINFAGAPIPIPYTTFYYANGVASNVTLFGSLHTTSLLFANAQTEIGATFDICKINKKLAITGTNAFQVVYNFRNASKVKIWPSIDLNAYYHLNEKNSFVYGGLSSWIELSRFKAHQQIKTRTYVPTLQIGYQVVNTKFTHQIEMKYLGLGIANTPNVVDYVGLAGQGALGIYYGISYKF